MAAGRRREVAIMRIAAGANCCRLTGDDPMARREIDPEELRSLTEIFRRAGADDPESWARSQLSEGIPQLAIFSFAKALWNGVMPEVDDNWIDREIEWAKSRPR